MSKTLLTYLHYGRRFCGIEHTTAHDNGAIQVTVLTQSKKELDLETTFQCNTIVDVSKNVPKNQHATLVINNEQVLTKTIENDQNDGFKLVYKAFPNINLDEFYFEIISEASRHFIAICRKDYVDPLIVNYSNKNIHIIDFSIGNSLISTITPFLKTAVAVSSNARISIENKHITDITKSPRTQQNYDINGLTVSSDYLLSFSAALQTSLKNKSTFTNYKDKSNSLQNDFKQLQFFNQFLKFSGILILCILLVNFVVFNHYFNKVATLEQVSEINETTKQTLVKLDLSVSKKEKMVTDLLKSNGSKSAYYLNQIMRSLPKTLLISDYTFQPLNTRIKPNKPIALSEHIIVISGRSNDSALFSKWISRLEHISWITSIDIVDYGSVSNTVSNFEIKIVLNDD